MSTIKLNLNYFFALFVTGTMLALWFVSPLIIVLLLKLGGGLGIFSWVKTIITIVVFIALALVWKKKGALSPVALKPNAKNRFRVGNVILAIANSLIALSILWSVIGYLFVNGFGVAIGFILAGALMLAVFLNIIGIICIETSRLGNTNRSTVS
jgi:hypothetical protein